MKYQNLKAFEQSLSQASSKVYLVMVPSDQERLKYIQDVIQKALPKTHSLETFSAADVELRVVFDALLSPSLFGGDALVLLDECETLKKKELETLGEFLEKNSLAGFLLLGSRGKTALSKVVEKIGVVLDMSDEKPWEKEKRISETLVTMAKNEGKWIAADAVSLLIEKIGPDLSRLTQEVQKLICFVGTRANIERTDVFRLTAGNLLETPWQIAEEMIWDGGSVTFDPASFVPLIFSLRAQLQLGQKIISLLEEGIPSSEWAPYFPKVWPKTLEKRKEQAVQKGPAYFKKGLELLFKIETLSRSSSDSRALFDLLRTTLVSYG